MTKVQTVQYRVIVRRDEETRSVVAEIPVLHLADYGADVPEALDRLQAMLAFHLESLAEGGKPLPREEEESEGLYLRVKQPSHAA